MELKSFHKGNSQYLPEGKKEVEEEREERAQGQHYLQIEMVAKIG